VRARSAKANPDANYVPDNTNADCEVRKKWIELAAKHSVPIRCVHFTAPTEICEHNDAVRALNKSVCDPPQQLALDYLLWTLTRPFCTLSLVTYKVLACEKYN
jgi:hypothetical protein